MPGTTRGFFGRSRPARDPRLPPGQYDARDDWPVLHAEATPRLDDRPLDVHRRRARRGAHDVDVGRRCTRCRGRATPGDIHCVTTWSKLGMTFDGVSVDTLLAAARPLPSATHVVAFSHTGYTTNLPLADVTGGKAWVAWDADGKRADRRARRPGPAAGAAPVLLEERQVGRRAAPARPRRAGVLGAQRLPRPRRSLAGAALPGRLTTCRPPSSRPPLRVQPGTAADPVPGPVPARRSCGQTARVLAVRDETPRAKTFRLELPAPHPAHGRAVLRAPADRARRLHRVPRVLAVARRPRGRTGRR